MRGEFYLGQKTDFLNKMVAIKKLVYDGVPSQWGTQQRFVQEGSVPRSHHRKGTPFKYLPLTNGTPSTYLV